MSTSVERSSLDDAMQWLGKRSAIQKGQTSVEVHPYQLCLLRGVGSTSEALYCHLIQMRRRSYLRLPFWLIVLGPRAHASLAEWACPYGVPRSSKNPSSYSDLVYILPAEWACPYGALHSSRNWYLYSDLIYIQGTCFLHRLAIWLIVLTVAASSEFCVDEWPSEWAGPYGVPISVMTGFSIQRPHSELYGTVPIEWTSSP